MKLPSKFNNLFLSQRKRAALVRILFNNSQLLALDKSLGSLDMKIREKFAEDIFSICRNIAVISISYNLKSLSKCNNIYDLEKYKFI